MSQKTKKKKEKKIATLSKTNLWLQYLTVFLVSVVLYANTLKNGYVLDDFSVIKEHYIVKKGFDGIPEILKTTYRYGYWGSPDNLYRPLPLILFAVQWQLWPDNPMPAHGFNVLVYALSSVLLLILLRKMFKSTHWIAPFLITLVFTAHPLHTEVVANIKSFDELLCFMFLLLTALLGFRFVERKDFLSFVLAPVTYFFAFLSKESAITFLAVFPLIYYFFSESSPRRILLFTFEMIIPAVIFLIIRKEIVGNIGADSSVSVADNLLVATGDFSGHIATVFKLLGKYLMLLIMPWPLACDYSFNQIPVTGFSDWQVWLSVIVHVGMVIWAVLNVKKKKVLSFAVLFYVITMSIYSNLLVLIGSSFAERFLFVPLLAFCIALVWFLVIWLPAKQSGNAGIPFKGKNRLPVYAILIIVVVYSVLTVDRNKDWESNFSLYSADWQKSPESAHMRYYYGLSLMRDKSLNDKSEVVYPQYLDSAIFHFEAAARIYPTYADAYDQLGLAWYRKKDNQKALEYYQKAIQYNPRKPITYSNMGVIYFMDKQYDKALDSYLKAVKYNPAFADAWLNLGSTYGTLGQFDKAIESFQKCLVYNPQNATANYYIGLTYQNMNQEQIALPYLKRAHELAPDKFDMP